MKKYRSEKEVVCVKLTKQCNLNCKGCISHSIKDIIPEKVDLFKFSNILDKLTEYNVKKISYSGGEPLLVENIDSILELGYKRNFKQIVTSNGTLKYLNNNNRDKIEYIKISLWGNEEYYKKYFTLDIWHTILATITHYLRNNFKVGINLVVNTFSFVGLYKLIEYLLNNFPAIDNIVIHSYLPIKKNDLFSLNSYEKNKIQKYVLEKNQSLYDTNTYLKYIDFETLADNYLTVNTEGDIELQGRYSIENKIIGDIFNCEENEVKRLLNNMWENKYNKSIYV